MKKLTILLLTLLLAMSFASCGGDKGESASGSAGSETAASSGSETAQENQESKEANSDKSPAFSGDTIELFGLEWEEAFDIIGDGATSDSSTYISNDEIGLFARLTNHIDDMQTYRVGTVTIESPGELSFYGIKVGDTLKDADKILMDSGASYGGGLGWQLEIDDKTFSIKLTTSDDKTISSIEVSDLNAAGALDYADSGSQEVPDNPFAYEEDMHDLEPNYWE